MRPPPGEVTLTLAPGAVNAGDATTVAHRIERLERLKALARSRGNFGLSNREAAALVKKFIANPLNEDREFLDWLMRQAPGGRKPRITRDHRLKVVPS